MNKPSSGSQSRAGIGVSSVLMVLVVLAMAALSLLAFSSARTTESMTRRNAETSVRYYQLAAVVQQRLQAIDQAAFDQPADAPLRDWYEAQAIPDVQWREEADGLHFTITATGDAPQAVVAEGLLLEGEKRRYKLLSHRMENAAPAAQDDPYLNLIGD